jgi:hypothetical protein
MTFSLLWGTGFEVGTLGVTENVTYASPAGIGYIAGGIEGSYCLRIIPGGIVDGNGYYTYTLPIAKTDIYIGFHANVAALGTLAEFRVFVSSNYYSVRWIRSGTQILFKIYKDGALVSTGTTLFEASWHSLQIHYKVDNSDGVFELKVDGNVELTITGDTQIGAGTEITAFTFYLTDCWDRAFYFDNLYYGEGGYPEGVIAIRALTANGDNSVQWLPSSGSTNYTCVDGVPLSASPYVSASVTDLVDLYNLADFTLTDKTIVGVILKTSALKSDSGTNAIAPRIKIGATEYEGDTKTLSTTNTTYSNVWNVNPSSGSNWENAEIDDLIIGIKNIIT